MMLQSLKFRIYTLLFFCLPIGIYSTIRLETRRALIYKIVVLQNCNITYTYVHNTYNDVRNNALCSRKTEVPKKDQKVLKLRKLINKDAMDTKD